MTSRVLGNPFHERAAKNTTVDQRLEPGNEHLQMNDLIQGIEWFPNGISTGFRLGHSRYGRLRPSDLICRLAVLISAQ